MLAIGGELDTAFVLPGIFSDDHPAHSAYRLCIQQAFEGLSTTGSTGSYQFHGRSADGRVADISVISPESECVTVSVLSRENNGVASYELLDIVRDALNDVDVRPVADRKGASVSVKAGKLLFLKAGSGRKASGKPTTLRAKRSIATARYKQPC